MHTSVKTIDLSRKSKKKKSKRDEPREGSPFEQRVTRLSLLPEPKKRPINDSPKYKELPNIYRNSKMIKRGQHATQID